MTIAIGRRRLTLCLTVAPVRMSSIELPIQDATDDELAHLNRVVTAVEDRRRWEASAILYGGIRSA